MTDLNLKVGDLVELRNGDYSIVTRINTKEFYIELNKKVLKEQLNASDIKEQENGAAYLLYPTYSGNDMHVYGDGKFFSDDMIHDTDVIKNHGTTPLGHPIYFVDGKLKVSTPSSPDFFELIDCFNEKQSQQMYM